MFLIFWNFRGSFLRLIFGFWKFWNCILNHNSHFWGGLFYETFWFEASFSTGDDFIASSGINFLVPFLATKEALAPLANVPIMSRRSIRSFRHLECQNPSIISESIGIPNGSKKMGKKVRRSRNGTERNLIHIEEDTTQWLMVVIG